MVRQYVERAYLPAAHAYGVRAEEDGRAAARLESWHRRVAEEWPSVRFGGLEVAHRGDSWEFAVQVYLAGLEPDDVSVELVSDGGAELPPLTSPMEEAEAVSGAVNVWRHRTRVPADRPADHYTPRLVPAHPDAFVPLEDSHILWWDRSVGRVIEAPEAAAATRPETSTGGGSGSSGG
jgi:starch phosphorylase